MTFIKEKKTDRGRLVLEGELTLGRIRQLHEELMSSLKRVKHLDVNIAGAVETDLSFLQLLCSAHQTAVKMGKTLSLASDLPEILLQTMESNGYSRHRGCSLDIDKTCLWTGKKRSE